MMNQNVNEVQVATTQNDSMALTTQDYREKLKNDVEVVKIKNEIDVKDSLQILAFGEKTANEVTSFSEQLLSNVKMSDLNDTGKMMKELTKIMEKVDLEEIKKPASKGFLGKLFNSVDKLLDKYKTVGGEITKVKVEMEKFRQELTTSVRNYDQMYAKNMNYYNELQKHIVAGQLAAEEMKTNIIPPLEQKANAGDQLATLELSTVKGALDNLEQRLYSLELAGVVSFQTAPQIRLMQHTAENLIRQISESFITTIPIFQQGVLMAVNNKRNKMAADANQALREKTQQMLKQNAANIAQQSIDVARQAGQPVLTIEDVEDSFAKIMNGMRETKRIEDEMKAAREEGTRKIIELQDNFKAQARRG
jgi:uncharacterized protein YaaN involved in tellurite resistance